jgi:hypothetical protein
VARQEAEIVDLEAYRVRRADARTEVRSADSKLPPEQHQIAAMSFLIPAVFFVFWPTWVFSPQFADVQWRGAHGGT